MSPKEEIAQIERQTTQISQVYRAVSQPLMNELIDKCLDENVRTRELLDTCVQYIKDQAFQFPKKAEMRDGKWVILERGAPCYSTEEKAIMDAYNQLKEK